MAALGPVESLDRLGSGREAEVFALDNGRALRLARDPQAGGLIEREFLALTAAHRAGAPVPAAYELVTVSGRPGLVMDRLDGNDLLTTLSDRPLLVWSAARTLGQVHASLHEVQAPVELPTLHEVIRERLASELVPANVRERASRRLDLLPEGDRLYHGDFHPANLVRTPKGFLLIDWTNGARSDPTADVARTRLLIDTAAIQADDVSAVVRRFDRVGRRLLLAGYQRTYRRIRPLDRRVVSNWLPVLAAARLAEGIEADRGRLLAIACQ